MKNPFKKLSGSLKKVLGVSTLAAAVLLSPVANAELANDPFIRDGVTDRKNFEPGGKYHLFGSARGTVTNRGGQINIDTLNHLKVGNLDIEQGIIHGEITYHTDFRGQGHGWEVHSPFDEHASRSKSDKNDIIGVSSTAYSIEWTGELHHPADGYDAPQGGRHPLPTGARDEYTYKVKGIADSVDIDAGESISFWQRMKNRYGNAVNAFGGLYDAWDKATTHNPNLNRGGNLAETANAIVEGAGSVFGAGWELVGGSDATAGAAMLRDAGAILVLNGMDADTQIETVNDFIELKGDIDDLKSRYERWEAENPNAAEVVDLSWNVFENFVLKDRSKNDMSSGSAKRTKEDIIKENNKKGKEYEKNKYNEELGKGNSFETQVYLETDSGKIVVADMVGKDKNGNWVCIECKSSDTARLTKNQENAYPEVAENGATVKSRNKESLPYGTRIPPTDVEVRRPTRSDYITGGVSVAAPKPVIDTRGRGDSGHSGSGRGDSGHSGSGRGDSGHSGSGRGDSGHSGSGRGDSGHAGSGRGNSGRSYNPF